MTAPKSKEARKRVIYKGLMENKFAGGGRQTTAARLVDWGYYKCAQKLSTVTSSDSPVTRSTYEDYCLPCSISLLKTPCQHSKPPQEYLLSHMECWWQLSQFLTWSGKQYLPMKQRDYIQDTSCVVQQASRNLFCFSESTRRKARTTYLGMYCQQCVKNSSYFLVFLLHSHLSHNGMCQTAAYWKTP